LIFSESRDKFCLRNELIFSFLVFVYPMSGHSKWATTKRQKAVVDAKKGAAFTKIARIITVAAREKGGDPETNFSLRMAIEKARAVNMPKDNIERAIKRGTGGNAEEAAIEEIYYEAVGPANSQFIVKCLTDNRNRTASEIRHLFSEHNGSLSSVMWNFEHKGIIMIAKEKMPELNEELELELIDNGADNIIKEEDGITIYAKPEDLMKLKSFLEQKNIEAESAELGYAPKTPAKLSGEEKEKFENFIERLEENEDISDYYTNVQ